ncbi:MAG TPA: MerR family transcriptional regulator, partial [Nannocystis exedens]|nr:MerR family transcriptional regulator [Nannocystis exedens]
MPVFMPLTGARGCGNQPAILSPGRKGWGTELAMSKESEQGLCRLKIGQLARMTGKTRRALHLYEEMGLLEPQARTSGGFRLYGPDQVARVYWISKLQDMGFSLPQIQSLLASVAASETAPEAMHGVRELFQAKLDETRKQVMRLLDLERDLIESLSYLEGCRVCSEPAAPEVCTSCTS